MLTNAGGFTLYWFAPDTPGQIELQRFVRHVLAAGQGTLGPGPGNHRQARHDHPVRRHSPGHLQRASSLHLRRRHRPRPGQGQRPQPVRRGLARGHRVRGGRGRLRTVIQLRRGRRPRVLAGPKAAGSPLAACSITSPPGPRGGACRIARRPPPPSVVLRAWVHPAAGARRNWSRLWQALVHRANARALGDQAGSTAVPATGPFPGGGDSRDQWKSGG
jgi:hypothetical protein